MALEAISADDRSSKVSSRLTIIKQKQKHTGNRRLWDG